jgi:hypothetical protein
MLRYFRPRYFFLTLEKPPIIVSRKIKDEIEFSNFNKKKNNLQNIIGNTDELKYYNQNFNLKSKVNWKFEW